MLGSTCKKFISIITVTCLAFTSSVFASEYSCDSNNSYSDARYEFSDYMTDVQAKVDKNWAPPESIQTAHVKVVFTISREGELISYEIKESSGDTLFDESVKECLKKAAPFNHFPESSTRQSVKIAYDFNTSAANAEIVEKYYKLADEYCNRDNKKALEYVNLAINEIKGDSASYFLYARRSKIKELLGDVSGAEDDKQISKELKIKFDNRRIAACKLALEQEESPYGYFSLANAYRLAGDYDNALKYIDKAIGMTKLNNNYLRYKAEIVAESGLKL